MVCIACQLMIARGLAGCGDHADPLPIEVTPELLSLIVECEPTRVRKPIDTLPMFTDDAS